MLRTMILSTLLIATAAIATGDYSSAIHTASSKVLHDGDYINFQIEFKASCYDQQGLASAAVINNVQQFSQWLDQINKDDIGGDVTYNIELINTWRLGDNYYGSDDEDENVCIGKHYASQRVRISLTREPNASALDKDSVQEFYNGLQLAITPYWYNSIDPESHAYSTAKITDVTKGLFEDTIDMLRRKAKLDAKTKATSDFLSVLGEGYAGWWYLDRADFSERSYPYNEASLASLPDTGRKGSNFVPAQLKLKPLSVTAEGTFIFHFECHKNHHGNA